RPSGSAPRATARPSDSNTTRPRADRHVGMGERASGERFRAKGRGGASWLRRVAGFGAASALVLSALGARASGVDPTKISLPKGPGSIEGLASADFTPSLSTGAASYEVAIAVPPASAGFGPKLALS